MACRTRRIQACTLQTSTLHSMTCGCHGGINTKDDAPKPLQQWKPTGTNLHACIRCVHKRGIASLLFLALLAATSLVIMLRLLACAQQMLVQPQQQARAPTCFTLIPPLQHCCAQPRSSATGKDSQCCYRLRPNAWVQPPQYEQQGHAGPY